MNQDKIWDYFQNSDSQDYVFPEARQRYISRLLKSGQYVLNIGIGSGALERLAIERDVIIHSLDPSEQAIDRLRQTLNMNDRARVGYAQNIPFRDETFDIVVMSEVLEHLDNETLAKALQEVSRVLKKGGKLIATTPYKEDLSQSQVVCPKCGFVFHRVGHVQSFDKKRIRALLNEYGYAIERIWNDTFIDWRRGGIRNFIKSVIRKMLARIGEGIADPHIIVIAKKP
jgi:ubiquinone/menaquinone biosynthesis C-methylase UbiE